LEFKTINLDSMDSCKQLVQECYENAKRDIVDSNSLDYASVIQPIITLMQATAATQRRISILSFVSTDKEIREKSSALEVEFSAMKLEFHYDKEIYTKFKAYSEAFEAEKDKLSQEQILFFEELQKFYRREGMMLENPADLDKVIAIKKDLTELKTKYKTNVIENSGSINLDASELNGLPDSFFKNFKAQDNGNYIIPLNWVSISPVLMYANREVRKKVYLAYSNRCRNENLPIVNDMLSLRHELASILGYSSFSDYVLEETMLENGANVEDFIKEFKGELAYFNNQDKIEMRDFVRELTADPDFELQKYDLNYYGRLYAEHKIKLDPEEVKTYFSPSKVIQGTMALVQNLLGLEFVEAQSDFNWHKDVKYYRVFTSDDTRRELGGFYLDIFPREGKYSHACAYSLAPGYVGTDKVRSLPEAAMICNFPLEGGITFSNVKTFFHEFGHLMHSICAQNEIPQFESFAHKNDFIEVPSQLLEQWCYLPWVIKNLSSDPTTGIQMPDEMVEKLANLKSFRIGSQWMRQLVFAEFDLSVHMNDLTKDKDFDIVEHFNDIFEENTGLPRLQEAVPANFLHITDYASSYYSYLYSLMLVSGIYSKFTSNNFDPSIGISYRDEVLAPAAAKNANDIVYEFLGRKANTNDFINMYNLTRDELPILNQFKQKQADTLSLQEEVVDVAPELGNNLVL